jgi:hypothetical protein
MRAPAQIGAYRQAVLAEMCEGHLAALSQRFAARWLEPEV